MENPINATVLDQERLSQVLGYNKEITAFNVLLPLLVAFELWGAVPQWAIVSWMSACLLIAGIRYTVTDYFTKHPVQSDEEVMTRLKMFRAGVMISGALWGLSAWLVYGHHIDRYELFIAYMIAGVSAGTAIVYLIDLVSALSFLYLGILPMLVMFLFSEDSVLMIMSVATATYLFLTTVSMKVFNRKLIEGIYLRWKIEQHAQENEKLALYDALTGLPNRRLLMERLEVALRNTTRTAKPLAVMFIDLDKFKALNDKEGHDMGDVLLKQFAERLQNNMRETDTVARIGGDEFVVMMENLNEANVPADMLVKRIADKLMVGLQLPYQLSRQLEYSLTPSIGIAVSSTDGATTVDALLKNADMAMYEAKKSGRNNIKIHDAAGEYVPTAMVVNG